MEQAYWLRRKRASLKQARIASDAEARLIHYELAGRYSVLAAQHNVVPGDDESERAQSVRRPGEKGSHE